MYFGVQTNQRHHQYDALPYEVPCAGPSLIVLLRALLRRLFH